MAAQGKERFIPLVHRRAAEIEQGERSTRRCGVPFPEHQRGKLGQSMRSLDQGGAQPQDRFMTAEYVKALLGQAPLQCSDIGSR